MLIEILGFSLVAFGLGLIIGAWWMYTHVYMVLACMSKFQLDSLADDVVAERRKQRAKATS